MTEAEARGQDAHGDGEIEWAVVGKEGGKRSKIRRSGGIEKKRRCSLVEHWYTRHFGRW